MTPPRFARPGDFTTDTRVLLLAAMAVVVGTGGVAGAWVLLRLIALFTNLAYYGAASFAFVGPAHNALGWWAALVPAAGGLLIGLMARYGSEKIRGHGIPEAIEAILIGGSRMDVRVAILKPISSALSIGTGGPFGAEGPIIMTGGALGSLFAQRFAMTAAERKVLLVAGAAAGMAAVFGTPIAAVLLAVELLLFEWKPRSFIPVVVACVTAALERGVVLAPVPLFPHLGAVANDGLHALGWVALGIACGLGSGLLTAMVYGTEDSFGHLPIHWMWWPAIGGLVVGVGGVVEPSALGVGYGNIAQLLTGSMVGRAALLLLVVKSVIWAVSLGSGTSGGVLAPLLMMGGALGALAAPWLPGAEPGFWAMIGMAAMMGGTMRAPLTAALFAVELTGDFAAILPLFAACATAYAVTVLLLRRSILTEKVARRGHHIVREYLVDPYALVSVRDVMANPVETLDSSVPAAEAAAFFTGPGPRHKAYPVVDRDGRLAGMISRADALAWLRDPPSGLLGDVVAQVPASIAYPDEPLAAVMDRMVQDDTGRIPVIAREDGRVVGLLARKDLLRVRARMVDEEHRREGPSRAVRPVVSAEAAAGAGE
ncbi:chloride channel protein [Acidisphaera rubrifaciens]|uniref:chloride channel protein n=1 Tax=Acidisphaera rubrifaciens TaxID=50715 RepID=UPI000AF501E3|nr:chloride channel protein [Acidisphaera rubrifaciens]